MSILYWVKELEGKTHAQRLEFIRQMLEGWQVPYQLQKYRTGTNLFVKAETRHFIGIGSHYDVVPGSPGANDNASAIAVTLDLVRRMQSYPSRHLSLQFFFFDEEENGLKGSKAYLEKFGCQGMKGLFNLELVGMGNQLALWPLDSNSEGCLLETLEQQCTQMQICTSRFNKILTHSADHVSFRKAGLSDAFTLTCISEKDLQVAQHYYKALEFDVDHQTLREIISEAPIFRHYHQTTDLSIHLQERALRMTSDALWNTYQALDKKTFE
jgi:hypothetical protein